MKMPPSQRFPRIGFALVAFVWLCTAPNAWSQSDPLHCTADQREAVPKNFEGCLDLQKQVEDVGAFMGPAGFRLAEYETLLNTFFGKYCHRNAAAGWVRDKRLRDTGPYTAILQNGAWTNPSYFGTHLPVVIWYNPRMMDWLHANRPAAGPAVENPPAIPDGAVMVKEMYPPPAALCGSAPPEHLLPPPTTGFAFMIKAHQAAHDGWFWGAWWQGFQPDWPAQSGNGLPAMGFAPYCLNCHASAQDNSTFADLANIQGEPGEPHVYLSQNFHFDTQVGGSMLSRHRAALDTSDDPPRQRTPLNDINPAFAAAFPKADPPSANNVAAMPAQTYDHVWAPAGGPTSASQFLTSDQCVGCHDAGSTGLQFDMTEPAPNLGKLLNESPYGAWRTSPMGLGGRDPVFFAQLASETETFHPTQSSLIQNVCLGCHGIQGQRQFQIDHFQAKGECGDFDREALNAIPYPADPAGNPQWASAPYGALGRDGIACTACHRMALTDEQIAKAKTQPENHCVEKRQQLLNPHNQGFARTFTGSFFVGPPDELNGPFVDPKTQPMQHAMAIKPVADTAITSSELCGSCHTVHLPIFGDKGQELGFVYEQTTYPEWAFSAYRTGVTADGNPLPLGPGPLAESCQGCHMKSADPQSGRFRSKIASIQEFSNFPETSYTLPAEDIDLPIREGFARHTLVGLNVFLIAMAQQFPDILGIPTQDPMMVSRGLDPVLLTERAMLDQASNATAKVSVTDVRRAAGTLEATVKVENLVGHKIPSGVGFRRAFLSFEVLDANQRVLWASGRVDGAGAIVDDRNRPIAGEYWWAQDCSARLPGVAFQPHYQKITAQNQAQIYQELVVSPAPTDDPRCGPNPAPGGQLTTSFLSICGRVKDNRLLPHGFLSEPDRLQIAQALGAQADLAREIGPDAVGDDPDYRLGGGDTLTYAVDLASLSDKPAYLRAVLYSQAIPPFFLQDRFCTSRSTDTDRLYYIAGHLDLTKSRAADWKLQVVGSGLAPVN